MLKITFFLELIPVLLVMIPPAVRSMKFAVQKLVSVLVIADRVMHG